MLKEKKSVTKIPFPAIFSYLDSEVKMLLLKCPRDVIYQMKYLTNESVP